MIGGKSVLAVITARGGSKGVPGKNIRPLAGKPMIGWTLDAVRGSHFIDRAILSTDSDDIADVAKQFDIDAPFRRPDAISGDVAMIEDAVRHAVLWAAEHDRSYDLLVHVTPANPLRTAADIDSALEALVGNPAARAIMTLTVCDKTPLFANTLPADKSMSRFIPEEIKFKNRQELPTYYNLTGAVSVSTWDSFITHNSFLTPQTYAMVVGDRSAVDIDTMKDFLVAELYFAHPEL
jgi:CMP-N-acetylneuraminic acid synthetase